MYVYIKSKNDQSYFYFRQSVKIGSKYKVVDACYVGSASALDLAMALLLCARVAELRGGHFSLSLQDPFMEGWAQKLFCKSEANLERYRQRQAAKLQAETAEASSTVSDNVAATADSAVPISTSTPPTEVVPETTSPEPILTPEPSSSVVNTPEAEPEADGTITADLLLEVIEAGWEELTEVEPAPTVRWMPQPISEEVIDVEYITEPTRPGFPSALGQEVRAVAQTAPLLPARVITMQAQTLQLVDSRQVGAEWICVNMLERLGLRQWLQARQCSKRRINLIVLLVVGALMATGSDARLLKWFSQTSGLAEILGDFTKPTRRDLTETYTDLLELKDDLQHWLYAQVESHFSANYGQVRYLATDGTNVFTEGNGAQAPLLQYGRSKEKRSDCRLQTIIICSDELGFIRQTAFHPGNVCEAATLQPLLADCPAGTVIVIDAGFATQANIDWLISRDLGYLAVARSKPDKNDFDFDKANIFEHNGMKVKYFREEHTFTCDSTGQDFTEIRLYVCTEGRTNKHRAIHQSKCQRFEKAMAAIQQRIENPRGRKRLDLIYEAIGRAKEKHKGVAHGYDIRVDTSACGRLASKLSWQQRQDVFKNNDCYLLRTSEKTLTPAEIFEHYQIVSRNESIHRVCKDELKMRPFYHYKQTHIDAHLSISLIAYQISNFVRQQLKAHGVNCCWSEIVRRAQTQTSQILVFTTPEGEQIYQILWTTPGSELWELQKALNIDPFLHRGKAFKGPPLDDYY